MISPRILFWSITVSLGGFLFGFDTAVISGAEQAIQGQWLLSDVAVGQMVAMALYGTVIGALFGGIPCDRFGRKVSLIWVGVLYLVSAVGSALAPDVYWLMLFRFIGGLGVGASSVVAPVYISEISPAKSRGWLTAIFQLNLVIGILLAYISNYLIGIFAESNWRLMLGIEAVPALLLIVLTLFVPRSPRWLVVKRNAIEEARKVLRLINPATADEHLAEIQAHHEGSEKGSGFRRFISGRYHRPILLAFLIAFFNQVSGINAIIYYAPRIFGMAGMNESAALLSTAGVGITNLIFTVVGLALIDRFGRRFLLMIGSVGLIVSLVGISWVFVSEAFVGLTVPTLIFLFIASFAIGQGTIIWVFISEVFPNEVRGYGMSLGSGTHWVMAALIAGTFPYFAGTLGGATIFGFFAVMMVGQLIFAWKVMPETKGISLEQLEAQILKKPSPGTSAT